LRVWIFTNSHLKISDMGTQSKRAPIELFAIVRNRLAAKWSALNFLNVVEPQTCTAMTQVASATRLKVLVCIGVALTMYQGSAGAGELTSAFRRGVNIVAWPWSDATRNGSIEERIDRAKAAGFDFVRVGVEITPFLKQGTDPMLIQTVQAALTRTRHDQMGLLLTLFARDKATYRTGRLICGSEGEPQRFVEVFRQVIAQLPDSSSVAIEPLNEPPGGCNSQLNGTAMGVDFARLQWQWYQIVRKEKPHLVFIVNAGDWSDLDGLLAFDPTPYIKDPNTLMIFHYYEPKLFTEQGMPFKPEKRLAQHVPWPLADRAALTQSRSDTLRAVDQDTAGDYDRSAVRTLLQAEFDRYPSEASIEHIHERFKAASDWARRYGLDAHRVAVTEFGVARVNHTEGTPPPNSALYLTNVRATAEANGFGWAIWDLDTGFAVLCGHPPDEKLCPEYSSVMLAEN
jgi:endoglucanase